MSFVDFGEVKSRVSIADAVKKLGLRNSHDKTFPIGVAFGAQVFVCSNLSFIGDHVIRRKHTAKAKIMLPGLLMEIIEPLAKQREQQALTFDRYRQTMLTDERADHAILTMYRKGVINLQRIGDVMEQWEHPTFEGFEERSAWRLFNATTFALTGRVAENPAATRQLHNVIDDVCTPVIN